MGRHMQQSLLFYNLQLSIGLERMPICIPFLHWWWAQPLFCTGHNQKEEKYIKGEIKRDCYDDSFGISWLPHLGSVCLIKDLSAWAELSCDLSVVLNPLVCCSKYLFWGDKNWGREINRPDKTVKTNSQSSVTVLTINDFINNFSGPSNQEVQAEQGLVCKQPGSVLPGFSSHWIACSGPEQVMPLSGAYELLHTLLRLLVINTSILYARELYCSWDIFQRNTQLHICRLQVSVQFSHSVVSDSLL